MFALSPETIVHAVLSLSNEILISKITTSEINRRFPSLGDYFKFCLIQTSHLIYNSM